MTTHSFNALLRYHIDWFTLCSSSDQLFNVCIFLTGAIGGSLGLAMGCSMVTFLEFIVFGFQAIYCYIRYCNTDDDGDCEENRNSKRETTTKKELENSDA